MMKMQFKLIFLCLISLFISCAAYSKNVSASDLVDGNFDATIRENRIIIANDISRNVRVLNSAIPDTSPVVAKWLRLERREIDALKDKQIRDSRITELVNTADFQQDKLKNYLKNILATLSCIQKQSPISNEMYCWSYLGFLLTGQVVLGDALNILGKEGKLPANIDADLVMEQYNWYGRGILQYIIIPYIGGDIR